MGKNTLMNTPSYARPARWIHFALRCALIAVAVVSLSACFGGSEPADENGEVVVRAPHPTFTPTPPAPTVAPTPEPSSDQMQPSDQGQPAPAESAPGEKPKAVITSDYVYARRGPGTNFDVIQFVMRGEEYAIVGKSADGSWWRICCIRDNPAWVTVEFADTTGPVDSVPVQDENSAAPTVEAAAPTETPKPAEPPPTLAPVAQQPAQPAAPPGEVAQPVAPTAAPAPIDTPAPAFPFNLVAQEQFPENNNLVRIFLYVYQKDQALEGLSVRVKKDGAELPVNGQSADAAGFTWPIADPRQRFQNMKVEFDKVSPAAYGKFNWWTAAAHRSDHRPPSP